MLPTDLLSKVIDVLDALRVPYFLTGSAASAIWGEPRFTNDVDLVVALPLEKVKRFCASFPEDEYYVSEEMILDAIRHGGQFNIIHPASGFKADLIIADRSPLTRSRFDRARAAHSPIAGREVRVSSPEDVILKKLEFYQEGGSEKHLRDITGILKRQGDRIDRPYIERWAAQLGVSDIWRAVVQRVEQR